uniref:Tetratricopeptide repeat domain 6 n=1 Tax=Coturnix japonica TaxID=93934 RepID=A0A8C2U8Q2_COTJA
MKKQASGRRVMNHRNRTLGEDSDDKNESYSKVNSENVTHSQEGCIIKLPVIASFAGTVKKIPPQEPRYCRSSFHTNNSPILLEKTKAVSKVKDRDYMLEMIPYNLRSDKTEKIGPVIKDSDEFGSADLERNENIPRKEKLTRESCKKRSKEISKLKQQDLHVELERVLRNGSKQPSVRSAREQLEEVRDVTRLDTWKIYENFQQSKPEEPTSTAALPVKVVARSVDEIIASLQSTSPSSSEQMIKELPESVLGQKYNIKMEVGEPEQEQYFCLSCILLQFREWLLRLFSPLCRHQNNRSIHHLCTAFPGFMLPPYLQMASRIYHTSDRRGHNILFTAEDIDNRQKESIYSEYIYLKELAEWKRYELIIDVSLYPEALKMFWAPIPPKFFAPISSMKDILFPKYEVNILKTYLFLKIFDFLMVYLINVVVMYCTATLVMSVSLGRLLIHNKFIIKVSPAIKLYQSPSIPCLLDFEKFAEVRGGIPKETSALTNLQIELVDSMQPVLLEGAAYTTEDLEEEVRRLTDLIEKVERPSAFQYCRRGAIRRKLGKLKSAMDDLEKVSLILEPQLLDAYWHRHLIYLFQDNFSAALDDLNFITESNKNKVDAYLSKAEIYRKLGDNTMAINNYSSAIQCNSTDDDIYFRRAELYFEEDELLLAVDDYAKCFQYNPKRTDALMKHGIYFFDHSILTTAIRDFTAVIREDPSNAQARLYRGRAYTKQKRYKNAIHDLAAAIRLDPSCWLAFYNRGYILREIDPKRALQDFSVSVLINDTQENFSSFLYRGVIYSNQQQWLLAICDFESLIALDSCIIFAYLNIGLILLLHLDQYYEAIRQFTNAIKIDPLNVQAYLCRAQAYHKVILPFKIHEKSFTNCIQQIFPYRGQYLMEMKKYELASLCIHQIAKMNEVSLEFQPVQQALIQSFCQNHSEAIECLRKAATTQPEPSMFVLLGKIQMKAAKTEDAVESFKKAINLLMTSDKTLPHTFEAAEMHYLLGLCYMEQVNLSEACDAFSKAVRLHSRYPDAFYQRGLCQMQLSETKCIQDFNHTLLLCPSHFQAYMGRAAYYESEGRYSKAIMNCNEAIKIHPDNVHAYFYRGILKYQNKTFIAAIEDFSKTIDLDNTCILAYYNRAICYHQIKNFRKALKDYGIFLLHEMSKEIVLKVFINRGLLYLELGDDATACEDFKEAALLSPGDSQIFQAIGTCHSRLNEFEEAARSLTQVLKLEPISVEAYIGRGNSYMKNGQAGLEQAQKDFLKAIHLNPMCTEARICLGYILQALGKLQSAWKQLTAVIAIDSKCDTAYEGRASVSLQMGGIFSAFQDVNAALKLTTTAQLLTNRGIINQLMGYLSCAMKDYQQAISVDPNCALAYFSAANIYFNNHQFSQAYCYYSEVLKLEPRNESAIMNRAVTNTILKNFEEAKEDFEKAICLCPFSAAVYFNRANFYNALNQYELAERDISTALSIQPNDAMMYRLRADIRAKLGFSREALEDYKRAYESV